MTENRLTFTKHRYEHREIMTQACAARHERQVRESLCATLSCPVDSCYTTSELMRDAVREGYVCRV